MDNVGDAAFRVAPSLLGLDTQVTEGELVTSVTTYEKNLRGFERIHLNPGETKTVSFTLRRDDLALWNRQMHFVVEPGKFKVMIGSGSEDIRLNGQLEVRR